MFMTKSYSNNRLFVLGVLVSIVIAYVSELSVNNQASLQKLVWVMLAMIGVLCIVIYRSRDVYSRGFIVLNLAHIPYIVATIYTAVLAVFIGNELGQVEQAFTTSMFIVVDMLAVGALISIFKDRAANVVFWAIVFSYALSMIFAIKDLGISGCIQYYTSGDFLEYNAQNKYFEKHDVGVAVIPFILYYVYLLLERNPRNNYERHKFIKIIVMLVIMVLCGKRVAMLALAVGLIMALLMARKMGHKINNVFIILTLLFAFCAVYVALIKSGNFSQIVAKLGINSMMRTDVYDWFADQYTLSPLYPGKGFQYIHRYMITGHGTTLINSFAYLHNSILQIYIEVGFIGFCAWIGYIILGYPMVIKKICKPTTFIFYTILLVPTVFMLTVDNIMTYPLYQLSMYTVFAQFMYMDETEQLRSIPDVKKNS